VHVTLDTNIAILLYPSTITYLNRIHTMLLAATAIALLFSTSLASVEKRTPSPIATPVDPNCDLFELAALGDTCDEIIRRVDIPADEFYRLNPSIGGPEGCNQGRLLAMMWYCVHAKPPPPPPPMWTAIVPIEDRALTQPS
jgi:hypothetical protein